MLLCRHNLLGKCSNLQFHVTINGDVQKDLGVVYFVGHYDWDRVKEWVLFPGSHLQTVIVKYVVLYLLQVLAVGAVWPQDIRLNGSGYIFSRLFFQICPGYGNRPIHHRI